LGTPFPDQIKAHAASGAIASAAVRGANAKERATDILPVIEAIKAEGNTSLRQIAAALNERGITTARGGEWSSPQVMRVIKAAQ
jgi:hypothetical protein